MYRPIEYIVVLNFVFRCIRMNERPVKSLQKNLQIAEGRIINL